MKENIEDVIDEVLKSEPSFTLRKDFKDRVIRTIRKKEKQLQRRLYLWMALGTVIMIGFGYGILAFFLPTALESFSSLNGVSNQLIPGGVMLGIVVLIIQYLDKKLVKDRVIQV